ncbi:Fc.00g081540.m01.CDS01 [Cosmosporella sp. VM-42]
MYDSDASFSLSDDDEDFDIATDREYNSSDATSLHLDDLDLDKEELDSNSSAENFDIDGQVPLYNGNVHPPEYYRQGIQEPVVRDPYSRYAVKTRLRLKEVEAQWNQYCELVRLGDPSEVFKSASVPTLHKFLEWTICQKVGKNGRKKRGTKTSGALNTRWKNLQIVGKVAMGRKFEAQVYNDMQEVLQQLTIEYKLRTTRRRNRFMTVETLKEQIETTLSTTEKSFDLGELRILTVLFLLLLAPGGSRAESILLLRFGDIEVALARDPEGGPHNLMPRFTPEFTKTYLGAKESTTFAVPEGIFHRSLFLSPQVFLLGILFRHRAFQAPTLTYPEGIEKLDIHPGENELPLPLKRDLDDVYIFRKAIRTLTGYEISKNENITYSMMSQWIKAIGRILGIEYNVISYCLRYLTGNKLDQSPDVSDALRNLCLGHANSVPFQRHYLSREICADTFAIVIGEAPQQALITQSCSIAHSISKRRPIRLTPQQVASIDTDPRIQAMKQKLGGMPPGSKKRLEASRNLRNAKQRMKNALLRTTREEWTDKQAVDDIERQLRGERFSRKLENTPRPSQHPAQKQLIATLSAAAEPTLEGQHRRRNKAVHAIIAYCFVEEGHTSCHTAAVVTKPTRHPEKPVAQSPLEAAVLLVFVRNPKQRPRRCFLCVGKALSLPPNDPRGQQLIKEFHTSSDLSRHFRRRHLSNLQSGDCIHCSVCNLKLDNKMHLQSHALRVHGTLS